MWYIIILIVLIIIAFLLSKLFPDTQGKELLREQREKLKRNDK